MATLKELARIFACDKYHRHSYMDTYQSLLGHRQVSRLLEIGIGYKDLMQPFLPEGVEYIHGSSLKMWATYWPEAEIWGCDIREDTLINEGNIRSLWCDQSDPVSLLAMVGVIGGNFDVVIDDGSHDFQQQIITASTLLPYMAPHSAYVIEDTYQDKGADLARMFGGRLYVGTRTPDDCLCIIER